MNMLYLQYRAKTSYTHTVSVTVGQYYTDVCTLQVALSRHVTETLVVKKTVQLIVLRRMNVWEKYPESLKRNCCHCVASLYSPVGWMIQALMKYS